VAGDDEERTYGIWGFVVVFAVLGAVGLGAYLLFGNTTDETVQLPAVSTTTEVTTTTVDPAATVAPVTVPGGAPAPDGVQAVVSSDGVTSYAFATPQELAQVPIRTVVARAAAVPAAGGSSLQVTVDCTVGVGEALAQLSITESPDSVTVLPVVLAPADAAPCAPDAVRRVVTVPLASPLGTRQVILVPAGTEVPTPAAR
jgi:hypothetical protein